MNRLVENRAVEPDDVLDVVFDLGRFGLVEMLVVRREMAVRDGMIVIRSRLVHVLRGEG